jgi:hypothetical protein
MRIRRLAASVLVVSSVIALGAGARAAPAFATDMTWTVSPGGNFTTGVTTATIQDTTSGTQISCASSHLTGTLMSGTSLPGAGLGSITLPVFTSCAAGFGVKAVPLPWSLNAVSYTAATHTMHGNFRGIRLLLKVGGCAATVTGSTAANGKATIKYVNASRKLLVLPNTGNLRISAATGCGTIFAVADTVSYKAAYLITPSQSIS